MPLRLCRSKSIFLAAATTAAVVLPAGAAVAEDREGTVTVSLPAKIVIDGRDIPVQVRSDSMYSSLDKVWVELNIGDDLQEIEEVRPNTTVQLSTVGFDAGTVIGTADLAQTDCDTSSDSTCYLDDDLWYYEFVDGLTYLPSAPATAKYASRVTLSGVRSTKAVRWTASVQRHDGTDWAPWRDVVTTVGPKRVRTDAKGVATWTERTKQRHAYVATVAESDTVWGGSSKAVRPVKQAAPARRARLGSSSTAVAVGRAVESGAPSVRKVVKVTDRNDPNDLLGRPNGYTSAAVLLDTRLDCDGDLGVDCGATIEKFATTAKAKQRKRYIQGILDRASFLGSEYDTVHGRFLLRVSGDLTKGQAHTYAKAFSTAF